MHALAATEEPQRVETSQKRVALRPAAEVWGVSHANRLVTTLKEDKACNAFELDKSLGESIVSRWGTLEEPGWKWPER